MASRSSSVSTDGTYRLAGWEESTPPPSGAAPTLVADTGVELRVLNATSARKPIDDLTDSTGELAIRREAATAVPADAIEKGSPIPKDSANRRSNDDAEKANRPRGENFLRRILNRLPRRKIKVSDETTAVIDAAAASATASQKSKPIRLKKKRKNRWDLPAWGISAVVHAAVLGSLGAMSLSAEVRSKIMNLNTSMFKDTGGSADELTKIYADQSDGPRDLATGDVSSSTSGSGSGDAPPRSGVFGCRSNTSLISRFASAYFFSVSFAGAFRSFECPSRHSTDKPGLGSSLGAGRFSTISFKHAIYS